MTFVIPNLTDAEDASQAQIDSRDFSDILAMADQLYGVLSGCAVTAQSTPDMTVAVAAGSCVVGGVGVAVSAGNVTISTADATNPRFDLICVDNTGTKSAVAGTAASSPVFPSPSGKTVLAAVRVPAADTTIENAKITDKRVILSPFALGGKPSDSTFTDWFGDIGMTGTLITTYSPTGDTDVFFPLPVLAPVAINAMRIRVTAAGASGKVCRLGIYRADANWHPLNLLVDASTVLIDTTGEKSASISTLRLAPGRYLTVLNHNDFSATINMGAQRLTTVRGCDVSAGTYIFDAGISRVNGATAAFPDPASGSVTVPQSVGSASGLSPIYLGVSEAY